MSTEVQQMRIVTMRVAVPAGSDEEAATTLIDVLNAGCIHPPQTQMLACTLAKEPLNKAFAAGDFEHLQEVLEYSPIAIPLGQDYQLVDLEHGGMAEIKSGENTAWVGVSNPNHEDGEHDGAISIQIGRSQDGVDVDLYGRGAENESLSSSFVDYSDALDVQKTNMPSAGGASAAKPK